MNEQLDIEKERAEFEKLSAGLTWLGKLPCGTYSDPTTAAAWRGWLMRAERTFDDIPEVYKALSIMQEELDNTGQFNPDWTNYRQGRVDGFQEALEKKPLSDVEISKAFCDETGVSIGDTIEDAFEAGVRFGEKYHGIGVE